MRGGCWRCAVMCCVVGAVRRVLACFAALCCAVLCCSVGAVLRCAAGAGVRLPDAPRPSPPALAASNPRTTRPALLLPPLLRCR